MIVYPPPVTQTSTGCNPRGNKVSANNRKGNGGGGRQTTQIEWKSTNVAQGIVKVDSIQLNYLIKTDPIEKLYHLDREPFAQGAFASVRRVRSRETGQVYAAKFSNRTRYGDDSTSEIYHEIALLSLCSPSPRIVKLHDVFQTPQQIIIVMEFAPGGDMQTIIDDNVVPFEADVVRFVQHVVEGLAYLHHRKIAHLDIKPQNLVMMGDFPDCDVKVCDFEISRVILDGTEIRELLGTPEYVAPEILQYEPITLAADMWSLGVTVYVLLTGFSPFGGETDQETFLNISQAHLDFPQELFEDVSDDAIDFIKRLLNKNPRERMTAKECLKHPWLANNKKKSNLKRTASTASVLSRGRVGCSSCSNSNYNQQNLRKYLSKSREALFEKVISKHKQHSLEQQSGPNLRKSTLLSQYDKTRRMCESQMSLVSKSREPLMQGSMSPSITRSREKLYGIKSLSKSHEVLNLTKTVSALASMSEDKSSLEGLLKTLTRAATASGELASLETIEKETEDEEMTNKIVIPDKPDSNNINIALDNSKIDRSILNISENRINVDTNIPSIKMNDEIVEFDSDKQSIAVNLKNSHQNQVPKEDKNIPFTSKMVLFQKQLSVISSEGEDTNSSALSQPNSLSLTEDDNLTSDSDLSEDQNGSLERITGDDFSCAEDDEPRFTVKQLISAYNMHQEIVTKTSLEVTMSANDPEQKILPVIDKVPNKKFPTGPNALRLFIPDIQITKSKRSSRRKSLRKSDEYVNKDNSIKEEEMINNKNLENVEVLLNKENICNETEENNLDNTNSSFNNITNEVCLNSFCKKLNSETDTAIDLLHSSGQSKSNCNFEETSKTAEDNSKIATNTYQDILTSVDQKSREDEILSSTKEEARINISGKIEHQESINLDRGISLFPEIINNNADFKTSSISTYISKSCPRVIFAANKSSIQNDHSTSKRNCSKEQIDLKKDTIHNERIVLLKQDSLKEITDSEKDIVLNEDMHVTKRHSLIELNNESTTVSKSQISRKDSTISNNEKFTTFTTKSTKEISPANLQCGELGSTSVNSSSADIPRRNRPNRNSRTETNFSLEPIKDYSQSNELRISKSNRNSTCSTSPHDSFAESLRKSSTSIYNNSTKNNATPRMNRKSFPCATRSTVLASTEKTRRKSNPAMKPPFY